MKKRILVIDDTKEIREIFRMGLEVEGFEVFNAIHGQDAMNFLEKLEVSQLPDLILLDLMMPVMDGHQFLEKILLDSRLNHIPTVIMTAKDNPVFTVAVAPESVLKKPISLELLLSTIAKNLLNNTES